MIIKTYRPKLYEILQRRETDEQTVEKSVEKKQNEKLVITESHHVVDPTNETKFRIVTKANCNKWETRD